MQHAILLVPLLSTSYLAHRNKLRVSAWYTVHSGLSAGNIWQLWALSVTLPSRRTIAYHLTEKK